VVVAQDTRTTLSNVLAGVWADNARRRRFSLLTSRVSTATGHRSLVSPTSGFQRLTRSRRCAAGSPGTCEIAAAAQSTRNGPTDADYCERENDCRTRTLPRCGTPSSTKTAVGQILSAWIAKEELRTLVSTVHAGGDPLLTRHRLHRFLAWCIDFQTPELLALAGTGYNRLVKQVKRAVCSFPQPHQLRPPDTLPLHPQTAGRNPDLQLIARSSKSRKDRAGVSTDLTLTGVECRVKTGFGRPARFLRRSSDAGRRRPQGLGHPGHARPRARSGR